MKSASFLRRQVSVKALKPYFRTTIRAVDKLKIEQWVSSRSKEVSARLHGCESEWERTVSVHEVLQGKTVCKGKIEVFNLTGHAKAKRCYAWAHRAGPNDTDARAVAVLEILPVESPETALRASIVADFKKQKAASRN